MSIPLQPRDQRLADQAIGARHQHAQWPRWRMALRRSLVSGTWASLCSSAVVSWLSHRRTAAVPAGTNATSQWVWGRQAHRKDGWSLRHTLVGYVIHHASSLFWASSFERLRKGRRGVAPVLALAAATTAVAYVVDYKVVPRRLTPGFETRLRPADLCVVYAAFGLGLALPWLLSRRRMSGTVAKRR